MRKRPIKTLKPSFFVSGVVGDFVGFPRNKRVIDGFARCLLCKVDLSIAGRGLHNLWDHWRGREHTRLEQKYRIMMNSPLLDRSCRLVSKEEDQRIRMERMFEPPVYLESALGLTVEERIAIEIAEAESAEKPKLSDESAAYLWLCNFINCFVSMTGFGPVVNFMESWADNLCGEVRLAVRSLTHSGCQVVVVVRCFFFT